MMTAPHRFVTRALFILLVVLCAGACQVRTDVQIEMKEDGSGTVTVLLGLDDDALEGVPNFGEALKTSDLTEHGWTIAGPVKETSGFTTFSASKPFANPDQANEVFKEITGDTGPFREFRITRSRSFAHTDFSFTGKVQFGAEGLESFGDSELAQQLDGEPLGQDITAIEQKIGGALDDHFHVTVTVRLPGDVDSNAMGQFANGARWQPLLSQPDAVTLEATSRSNRWFTIIGTAVAALSALALIVCAVVIGVRRRLPPAERRRGTVTPPS